MSPEKVFLATPIAAGRGGVIVSPFQFILTGDDHLRIEGWNTAPGAVLELSYRLAALDGQIRPVRKVLPLTADRLGTSIDVPLTEGYLVNMAVFVTGATPTIGQTFCCVKLIRGLTGATIVLGLLLQGYLTAEQGLGWPGSAIDSSLSGAGAIRTINGTQPAAGADIHEVVPTGARWELLSFKALMSTSVGAYRTPILHVADGATGLFNIPAGGPIPPPNPVIPCWIAGLGYQPASASVFTFAGLPTLCILSAGAALSTLDGAIDPTDQWSDVTVRVREWLDIG